MGVHNLENLTQKAEKEKESFQSFLNEFENEMKNRNLCYSIKERADRKIFKILDVEFYCALYLYDYSYNYDYTKIKVFRIVRGFNEEITDYEKIYSEFFMNFKKEKEATLKETISSEFFLEFEQEKKRIMNEIISAIEKIIVGEDEIKIA